MLRHLTRRDAWSWVTQRGDMRGVGSCNAERCDVLGHVTRRDALCHGRRYLEDIRAVDPSVLHVLPAQPSVTATLHPDTHHRTALHNDNGSSKHPSKTIKQGHLTQHCNKGMNERCHSPVTGLARAELGALANVIRCR